jgi:hypothetical protein
MPQDQAERRQVTSHFPFVGCNRIGRTRLVTLGKYPEDLDYGAFQSSA